MKAFPQRYLGCITRIQTRPDGSRYVWFWAMREGALTECMADESAYVREFPDRAVSVSSIAIGGSAP